MSQDAERVRILLDPESGIDAGVARDWAARLELPLCGPDEAGGDELLLAAGSDGLELRRGAGRRNGYARVDLARRALASRSGRAGSGEILRRAVGRKASFVVDATAGFGDDAIALAGLGHRVLAFERSPIVAALLEDGRRRALQDSRLGEIAGRLEVRRGDSLELLETLDETPDAVYIDPMYPESAHTPSALPPLKIQLLKRLAGADTDAASLLERALGIGARRVVVKRPLRTPALPGPRSTSHAGKLVRYDVYQALGNSASKSRKGIPKTGSDAYDE